LAIVKNLVQQSGVLFGYAQAQAMAAVFNYGGIGLSWITIL